MEDREAKSVIESLLFISGEPMTIDSIKKVTELDKNRVSDLVKELISDYSLRNSGLLIIEVAEGVQMVTNPASSPYVKKLISTAVPTKLSQPSLETLAIIAYKQPIIKAEIEAIRGVNSDGVVKTLLERRMLKILGRKEVPGRPLMYGTTKEFLQYFGLKDLTELPTLKELTDIEIPDLPEQLEGEEGEVAVSDDESLESAEVEVPTEAEHHELDEFSEGSDDQSARVADQGSEEIAEAETAEHTVKNPDRQDHSQELVEESTDDLPQDK